VERQLVSDIYLWFTDNYNYKCVILLCNALLFIYLYKCTEETVLDEVHVMIFISKFHWSCKFMVETELYKYT